MWPITAEEYDKLNEWRNGEDRRSELNDLLSVEYHKKRHDCGQFLKKELWVGEERRPEKSAWAMQ